MNFRTKEHYKNRIERLLSKGEVVNNNLIHKAKRKLQKKEKDTNV